MLSGLSAPAPNDRYLARYHLPRGGVSRTERIAARRPAGEELNDLLDTLSRRMVRVLEHRGLLIADPEHPCLDLEPGSSLDQLQAASIAYRIAIRPHAGRKALTL